MTRVGFFMLNCDSDKLRYKRFAESSVEGKSSVRRVACVSYKSVGLDTFCAMLKDKLDGTNILAKRCPRRPVEIAISLSHYKIWQTFLASDDDYAVVMEDDVTLHQGFVKCVRQAIDQLGDTFDVLYLWHGLWNVDHIKGYSHKNDSEVKRVASLELDCGKSDVYQFLREHTGGTVAYVVSRSYAKFLSSKMFPISIPVDNFMGELKVRRSGSKHRHLMLDMSLGARVKHHDFWTRQKSSLLVDTDLEESSQVMTAQPIRQQCAKRQKQGHTPTHGSGEKLIKSMSTMPSMSGRYEIVKHWTTRVTNPNLVISFSLYGGKEGVKKLYSGGALANIKLAKIVYPGWTCRFYVDDTVPQKLVDSMLKEGAQVYVVKSKLHTGRQRSLWRFLVAGEVCRFLVRDIDSRVNAKEASAVKEWCDSPALFHRMWDNIDEEDGHSSPLMGGMWGGVAACNTDEPAVDCKGNVRDCKSVRPAVPNIQRSLETWTMTGYRTDEMFLKDRVWPKAETSVMSHGCGIGEVSGRPFPKELASQPVNFPGRLHKGYVGLPVFPGDSAFGTSKAALEQFTKTRTPTAKYVKNCGKDVYYPSLTLKKEIGILRRNAKYRSSFSSTGPKKPDKLMIVAHPDDETIFGGAHLLTQKRWRVICLTNANNEKRAQEFARVMDAVDAQSIMFAHKDTMGSGSIDPAFQAFLMQHFAVNGDSYKCIVSHGPTGEYGHAQHRGVAKLVRKMVERFDLHDKHYVFGVGSELPAETLKAKRKLFESYGSQLAVLKKLGIQKFFTHEAFNKFDESPKRLTRAVRKSRGLHSWDLKVPEGALVTPNDVFDAIYVINLHDKTERWRKVLDQLNKWNVKAKRFIAVDGRAKTQEGAEEKLKEFEKKYGYGFKKEVRGRKILPREASAAASLTIGTLLILKEVVEKKWDRVLILEDDVVLDKDFGELFDKHARAVAGLPTYDMWYLGCGGECGSKGMSRRKTMKAPNVTPLWTMTDFREDEEKFHVSNPDDLRLYCKRSWGCSPVKRSKFISSPISAGGTWAYSYSHRGADKILQYFAKKYESNGITMFPTPHIDKLLQGIMEGRRSSKKFTVYASDPPIIWHEGGMLRADSDIPW